MTEAQLLEAASGIIANAGGGDWTRENASWQVAAARWRDSYHAWLDRQPGGMLTPEDHEEARQEALTAYRDMSGTPTPTTDADTADGD